MKIHTVAGPWFSIGIHIDFKHRHVDFHFLWWVIVIGNTVEPVYCGRCGVELASDEDECQKCTCQICGELESKHEITQICPKGSYKQARGIIPWREGDELPEVLIRRIRDGN